MKPGKLLIPMSINANHKCNFNKFLTFVVKKSISYKYLNIRICMYMQYYKFGHIHTVYDCVYVYACVKIIFKRFFF